MIKKITIPVFVLLLSIIASKSIAQDRGTLSGGLETNFNYFIRDSLIGASDLPQYDNLLYGADSWLNVKYTLDSWEFGLRFDIFNNSILKNPNYTYSGNGIGNWYIKKKIQNLEITAGNIYDQIGSGAIFRAYEERALFIDNSLMGLRLTYDLTDNIKAKVFTGKQNYEFTTYPAIIRGASIEGYFSFGKEKPLTIAPGLGFVNRTHDSETIDKLLNIIKTYLPEDRVVPKYNTCAATAFSTLSYDAFTLYVEGAMKSKEVFYDSYAQKLQLDGSYTNGKYVNKPGNIVYTSLSYAKNKLGITAEFKRTENFDFRVDPTLTQNDGLLNFIPPMNRLNTYTLTARYSPATQLLSEIAYQLDLKYAFNKKLGININFSDIKDLDGNLLYNELYSEVHYTKSRSWKFVGGLQYQNYNQPVYEGEGTEMLVAYTPFIDILHRISRKNQ
ncbi:MAG: DUF6029 family protein [Saprospiraceae bacterium]